MAKTPRGTSGGRARRPGGARGDGAAGQLQSVVRAMAVLERLSEAKRGITLSDLSLQLGLPMASVHRLLNSFEQTGFAEQDDDSGRWFIGVRAFVVGNGFLNRRDFVATARPFMRDLMERCGESVNLAILHEGEAVFISQVECDELMRMNVKLGGRAPLHASGVGKALLAAMAEHDVERLLRRHGLKRYTDHTIDTLAGLRADLAATRERGYCVDDEEHAVGLRCVAATIHDEFTEPIAAISLSGPEVRVPDERIPELGVLVARTAAEITEALGGRLPGARARATA